MFKKTISMALVFSFLNLTVFTVTPNYVYAEQTSEEKAEAREKSQTAALALIALGILWMASNSSSRASLDDPIKHASISDKKDKKSVLAEKSEKEAQAINVKLDFDKFGYYPDVKDALNTQSEDEWVSPELHVSLNW